MKTSLYVRLHIFRPLNHLKFQLKMDHQSQPITLTHPDAINNKKMPVTLRWLSLMFWCYQYTTSVQLQMLNYYNGNILKSMHHTETTWNFQARIFLSLRNSYATYNRHAITFRSQAYNYTTYNLQAIKFQSIRYTYTTYDLKAITFQLLRYNYTTYNLQGIPFQSLRYTYATYI